MAVYTHVPFSVLETFLASYRIGSLRSLNEILEGVENSNFLFVTDQGLYILTLFEKRVKEEDLPFFIELMRHAAMKGLPCPLPIADEDGDVLHNLCGRPAAVVSFLDGQKIEAPTPHHCRQVGKVLAQMQRDASDIKLSRRNALSLAGWEDLTAKCTDRADSVAKGLGALITGELAFLKQHWPDETALPYGIIHADMFMDNVFFKQDQLCGIIDFYFSCNDFLAYDLAITINAWCFENQKNFVPERAKAMIEGYESVRTLSEAERKALPLFLRGAALRFLLTRLFDWINHPPGALVRPHDPMEYSNKLEFFRTQGLPL
jgi:homoserine kinase type II